MTKHLSSGIFILAALSLSAVSEDAYAIDLKGNQKGQMINQQRNIDPVVYSKGQRLFLENCASCHGKQGEGAKNWRTPDAQGKNQPPPLNGTGHTWHHSPKALKVVIKNGTGKIGGNMPAWKDKLSNYEIELILTWITAQWSDEIYTSWYNRFHQTN